MVLYAYSTDSYSSPQEAINNGASYYIDDIDGQDCISFVSDDGKETKFMTSDTNKIRYNSNRGDLTTVISASQNTLTAIGMEGSLEYFFLIDNIPYPIKIGIGNGIIKR